MKTRQTNGRHDIYMCFLHPIEYYYSSSIYLNLALGIITAVVGSMMNK